MSIIVVEKHNKPLFDLVLLDLVPKVLGPNAVFGKQFLIELFYFN
jgi:hypothetical protein